MRTKIIAGAAALTIGTAGLSLIQTSEGKRNVAYLDSAGIPTICWGHTGPDVKLGQRATDAQCTALLHKDIDVHLYGVKRCLKVPLNQNRQDAVVSFAFNVGVTAFCNSTLARKINAGDFAGATSEFHKWNKTTVKGRKVVLAGLVTRRACEAQLFNQPYYGEIRPVEARFPCVR